LGTDCGKVRKGIFKLEGKILIKKGPAYADEECPLEHPDLFLIPFYCASVDGYEN